MKICHMCGEAKPPEAFTKSKNTSDGLYTYCRVCKNAWLRKHRRENPGYWREWHRRNREKNGEKINAQRRARYAANPKGEARRSLAFRIKRDFGMTLEEYDALVAQPCGLCGATENIVLDHCHETGKVRGPLCGGCNTGLGLFADDPELLLAAADYIESQR